MKKLLPLLLLTAITVTAYADKNNKAAAKSKTIKPKLSQQEQTVTPANNPASNDTAWHGTGKEHYEYGARSYDPRTARYGYVDIDSATAAKYGATRPTLPKRNNEPQAK
jgi:hypothetical protein